MTRRGKLCPCSGDMSAEDRELVIVCAHTREAAAIAGRMRRAQRTHYGVFHGYMGNLGGVAAAVAVSGEGEYPAYAAVRQMAFLFGPKWLANFGVAGAVREDLHAGDITALSHSRRCYCPIALADNMFDDDSLVFPDDEAREYVLGAPTLDADAALLQTALDALNGSPPRGALQESIPALLAGSVPRPLAVWRGREFVRARYGADVVDMESYGFLSAAIDTGIPGFALKVISDACSADPRADFERNAKRILKRGAEALETAAECFTKLAASRE